MRDAPDASITTAMHFIATAYEIRIAEKPLAEEHRDVSLLWLFKSSTQKAPSATKRQVSVVLESAHFHDSNNYAGKIICDSFLIHSYLQSRPYFDGHPSLSIRGTLWPLRRPPTARNQGLHRWRYHCRVRKMCTMWRYPRFEGLALRNTSIWFALSQQVLLACHRACRQHQGAV